MFATILGTLGIAAPPGIQSVPLDQPHPVWVEDVDPSGNRLRVGYEGQRKLVAITTAKGDDDDGALRPRGRSRREEGRPQQRGSPTLRASLAAFHDEQRPANSAGMAVIDAEREAQAARLG